MNAAGKRESPDSRRIAIDVQMQAGLGHFFAAKFRAGILYALYERTGYTAALDEALKAYQTARSSWVEVADLAKMVYGDVSASDRFDERGQWMDRLQEVEHDIAELERQQHGSGRDFTDVHISPADLRTAKEAVLARPKRESIACHHSPPPGFSGKEPVRIELSLRDGDHRPSVLLHYRHVNKAEHYQKIAMESSARGVLAQIPAAYTESQYPLQYYFELRTSAKDAWLYPGFNSDSTNQPYFILRRV